MFVCEAGSSTNMVRSVPDALKQHPCVCVQGVYMRVRVCVCLRVEQGFLQICKYDTVCARCVETAYVCMCVQCMSVFTCACVCVCLCGAGSSTNMVRSVPDALKKRLCVRVCSV